MKEFKYFVRRQYRREWSLTDFMFRTEPVTERSPEFAQMKELYESAFPDDERGSLAHLLHDDAGMSEVVAFYDGTLFCGFACLLTDEDITHILYFAIEDSLRGRGYGSKALEAVHRLKPHNRIIVDIELEEARAQNEAQREKRRQFYLHNAYEPTNIRYRWHGEDYEILSRGGRLTGGEFTRFWDHVVRRDRALAEYESPACTQKQPAPQKKLPSLAKCTAV